MEKYKAELSEKEHFQYKEKRNQMNRGKLISPIYKREYEFPMPGFQLDESRVI